MKLNVQYPIQFVYFQLNDNNKNLIEVIGNKFEFENLVFFIK